MLLKQEEKEMLEGKHGAGVATAMKILVGIGDAFNAEHMVKVNRAHISLINQEGDLWFVNKLVEEKAKCKIIATVNPAFNKEYFDGICNFSPEELKILQETRIAYNKIGVVPTFQCTPYLENNVPRFKEVVAYAASGASCFVNSVFGARTNRESSQSALCAAITGLTPLYGALLDKNRKGDVLVEIESEIKNEYDYQLLGYSASKKIKVGIPVFSGLTGEPTIEALMNLSTQLNVHGVVPMFHVVGVTPEAATLDDSFHGEQPKKKIAITREDIFQAKKQLSEGKGEIAFVVLGCPHLTISQIKEIANLVEGKKLKSELWIFTSYLNKGSAT
jgi:predicted aconitase